MITPGLLRRAFARASQWRLLLFAPVALAPAAAVAFVPTRRVLARLFDHSPRWREIPAGLDAAQLSDLALALGTPRAAPIFEGAHAGLLLTLLLGPLVAGAALAAARSDESLPLRQLLAGAAGYYGRLVRLELWSLLPLGAALGAGAWLIGRAGKAAQDAVTESSARSWGRLATLAAVLLFALVQLGVDAGRATLAAQPDRRSALVALWAGFRLLWRRRARTVRVGLATSGSALLLAALILLLRLRVGQGSAAGVALAALLGQLAVAAIAWGHAARLCGLAELCRADQAELARTEAFQMAPPATSPPPPTPAASPPAPAAPPEPPAASGDAAATGAGSGEGI